MFDGQRLNPKSTPEVGKCLISDVQTLDVEDGDIFDVEM